MKSIAITVAAIATLVVHHTDAASPKTALEIQQHQRMLMRALSIRPRRLDGPLRYENISDEEVREIQAVAAKILPKSIVNISGVTSGCPCEETSNCTDQVWIVVYRPENSVGLMLSRVDDRWGIGRVQEWWFDYEKLQSRRSKFSSYTAYLEEEYALLERFPVCTLAKENQLRGSGSSAGVVQ